MASLHYICIGYKHIYLANLSKKVFLSFLFFLHSDRYDTHIKKNDMNLLRKERNSSKKEEKKKGEGKRKKSIKERRCCKRDQHP